MRRRHVKKALDMINSQNKIEDTNSGEQLRGASMYWADQANPLADTALLDMSEAIRERQPNGKIFQPLLFNEAKKIVDDLLENRVVVVDFSRLPKKERLRLIDFITGVTYGHNGHFDKISGQIYRFTISQKLNRAIK